MTFYRMELARIKELQDLDVLNTAREFSYDEIVATAAEFCDTPYAMFNLMTTTRLWTKAAYGMRRQTASRSETFCHKVVSEAHSLEIIDTLSTESSALIPFTKTPWNIRYYYGIPLVTSRGFIVGTLCVLDTKSRKLEELKKRQLEFCARQILNLLESNKMRRDLARSNKKNLQFSRVLDNLSSHNSKIFDTMYLQVANLNHQIYKASSILTEAYLERDQLQSIYGIQENSKDILGALNETRKHFPKKFRAHKTANHSFHLKDFVKGIADPYRYLAHGKGIDFQILLNCSAEILCIGDSEGLRLVLNELLRNALDFTTHGMVRLELNVNESDDRSCLVSFRVIDTGSGLRKSQMLNYFDNLNLEADDWADLPRGLNLSKSLHIIENMGGHLAFNSIPNQGSVFWFVLKIECANSLSVDSPSQPAPFTGKNILVVTDDLEPIYRLRNELDKLGATFQYVTKSETINRLLDVQIFDCVIVDVDPDSEAYKKLTILIRQHSDSPIFALRAKDFRSVLHNADFNLEKPLDVKLLSKELSSWFSILEENTKTLNHIKKLFEENFAKGERQEFLNNVIEFLTNHMDRLGNLISSILIKSTDSAFDVIKQMRHSAGKVGATHMVLALNLIEKGLKCEDFSTVSRLIDRFQKDSLACLATFRALLSSHALVKPIDRQ
ncbi:MAG: hypothetical protein EOP07_00480 [Proteobacteria bacterium]|nr:MAG: hypothetical protein EOP07_00480 [Pseudomonadota bacterium]